MRFYLIAFSLIFVVRGSFADQYVIPSGSMEPTIAVGDHVLVDKTAYGLRLPFTDFALTEGQAPQRGDIVVFTHPESGMRLIKRLVGIPGDHLHIEDGFVTLNGEKITDVRIQSEDEFTYLEHWGTHIAQIKRIPRALRPESRDIVVGPGQYFAMGDNRDNSLDSRSWGFVPRDHILGRALGVIFNAQIWPEPKLDVRRVALRF